MPRHFEAHIECLVVDIVTTLSPARWQPGWD